MCWNTTLQALPGIPRCARPLHLHYNTLIPLQGTTIDKYSASPAAPAPAAGGAPPPPPPPPPPPVAPPAPAATSAAPAAGAAAVFAELNRGEEVTKGLRKVDKSEMTHKNPALRAGSTVPSSVGTTSPPSEWSKCKGGTSKADAFCFHEKLRRSL